MYMKIRLILFCLFFNFLFPIGLRALIIPQTASLLSQSGAGISYSAEVNPALLFNQDPYVSFSKNIWFGGISGQKISLLSNNKTYISFETLSVTDIELRDEIASDSPIGFFGAYWYAIELNRSIQLRSNIINQLSLGYKVKINLSKLYTETMKGYSIDFGINKEINNNLSLGLVIKNFGKEYSDNLTANSSPIYGLGSRYIFENYKLILISDLISQDNEIFLKLATQTNLPFGLNFILGGTYSNNYKDLSFGVKVDLNGWSLIYGNLNHDNSILGNPTSIEIKKYF